MSKSITQPDLASAAAAVRDQTQNVASELKDLGGMSKLAAEEALVATAAKTREAKDQAVAKAGEFEDQVVAYIREQPVKAILIAAGVGAVASMWMRR